MQLRMFSVICSVVSLAGCAGEKLAVQPRPGPAPRRSVPAGCPDVKIQFSGMSFVVDVPGGRDLASHLSGSDIVWGNEGIAPKDVVVATSTVSAPPRRVRLDFASFTGPVCSSRALRLIRSTRHRPATAEELVAFLKKFPDYPRLGEPIAALGTRWSEEEAGESNIILETHRAPWGENAQGYVRIKGTSGDVLWTEHEVFHDDRVVSLGSTECGWPDEWYFLVVLSP